MRTFGVEEEFLLVDGRDGRPRASASAVLGVAGERSDGRVAAELQLEQVEVETDPCKTLDELSAQIRAARRRMAASAHAMGVEIAALGTSPLHVDASLTPSHRYERMAERFGLTIHEQLTCGCHVHVAVDSDEEGVAVLDRIRPWLAPLLAMSANSPFWQGRDSKYASFRSQVWARQPSAGPTEPFGSARAYQETVRAMIDSDVLLDPGMIYFDARLSDRYPTVEVRVPDVCLHADDAVLVAAVCRALVETAVREWRAGRPVWQIRTELLRLAMWRAGRSGLETELIDPRGFRPAPAGAVLDALLAHVRPALEDAGEQAVVGDLRAELVRRGTGSGIQRAAYARTGRLEDVVADVVRRTVA
ncbi:carboxylate-amine ligase [Pseudonocardia sp. CA-142604]|uniref:carboxylate-amine ligase n=1 Tax=Pseudonocardia sp. CA-142604 TaxID=3240024 RepID=UPI003D92E723